jgi:formylglycine-generating enzyme required for sulfatase activity
MRYLVWPIAVVCCALAALAIVGAAGTSRAAVPLTADQERALKPGDSFSECSDCPEMVVVPSGSFMMGSPAGEAGRLVSEGPQRLVSIARPFAVGKFEVTRGEFAAFARENDHAIDDKCYTVEGAGWLERAGRSFRNPGFAQDDRHPVVCVSWEDASAFVAWLSKKTGKTYRLLTEAEWEYAARAGSSTRYHFGNSERDACTYGNVADETAKQGIRDNDWMVAGCRDGYIHTAPVGSYRPNAFGLFDMHGNVWEWVQDCASGNYSSAPTDGSVGTVGRCNSYNRVRRGGSWLSIQTRLAFRLLGGPVASDVGFRVARTLG